MQCQLRVRKAINLLRNGKSMFKFALIYFQSNKNWTSVHSNNKWHLETDLDLTLWLLVTLTEKNTIPNRMLPYTRVLVKWKTNFIEMIVFMLYNLMSKFCNERSKQAETEKNTKLKNIKVWKKKPSSSDIWWHWCYPHPIPRVSRIKNRKISRANIRWPINRC